MKNLSPLLMLFLAVFLLPMCKKKAVEVSVGGAVIFGAGGCTIDAPNEVEITVEIWNDQAQPKFTVSESAKVKLEPADQSNQSGAYNIKLEFPGDKDEPNTWRVVSVNRTNGDPLCLPDSCGTADPPTVCADNSTNKAQEAIGNLIDWLAQCTCK